MKFFYTIPVCIVLLASFLVACSGGGTQSIQGAQCATDHNPVPMDVPESQKVSLKAGDDGLPPGEYTYQRGDLYYVDTDTGLQLHLNDTKQRDGSFKGGIACVRNAREGMTGIAMATEGMSSLQITPSKVTTGVKQYGFMIDRGNIQVNMVPTTQPGLESPSEIFEGKVLEYFVIKHSDTDYEVRSTGDVVRDGVVKGRYSLSTRFQKTELPASAFDTPEI